MRFRGKQFVHQRDSRDHFRAGHQGVHEHAVAFRQPVPALELEQFALEHDRHHQARQRADERDRQGRHAPGDEHHHHHGRQVAIPTDVDVLRMAATT
ncbi:MAG: hypothetical protein R2810_00585 [Flavobacteriales bacterium]